MGLGGIVISIMAIMIITTIAITIVLAGASPDRE